MQVDRKILKAAKGLTFVLVALFVLREAFFGYTAYFFIVPSAKLFTNGRPSAGWMHSGGKVLILTRSISGRRESYWISLPGERRGSVRSCGDWSAPRFPVVAIGDVNPPCLSLVVDDTPKKGPLSRSPTFGSSSVAFIGDDGNRLRVDW